ncbi:MAG: hypothetical protein V7784_06380 [Oceanospirillaceae bacterium]
MINCHCTLQRFSHTLPLILVLLFTILSGCAPIQKGARIDAQKKTSNQDILDILEIASSRFESVLGKQLLKQPKVAFLTIDQLKAHIKGHDQIIGAKANLSLTHYSHSVSAIYCEEEKAIYVIPENIEIYERNNSQAADTAYYALLDILSHELVHALQDQEGLLDRKNRSTDEARAFSILVEGHTVMQSALLLKNMRVIKDIYSYGIYKRKNVAKDKQQDEQQDEYSKRFSQKYITGKKYFNKIHATQGNEQTWQALVKPQEHIKAILTIIKQG